jgi:hypothetical protein
MQVMSALQLPLFLTALCSVTVCVSLFFPASAAGISAQVDPNPIGHSISFYLVICFDFFAFFSFRSPCPPAQRG